MYDVLMWDCGVTKGVLIYMYNLMSCLNMIKRGYELGKYWLKRFMQSHLMMEIRGYVVGFGCLRIFHSNRVERL